MKEFNHNDMMDSALAPIEAQRDDALDELFKVKAENAALLAALEQVESLAHSAGSMERKVSWHKVYKTVNAAIAKAKGGE